MTTLVMVLEVARAVGGPHDRPPVSRVRMPDGGWLVASGTRVDVGGVAVAVVLGGGDVASVTAAFAAWAGLTSRETRVIRRIGEGLDDRSTARSPMISPLTVETRLTSIYRKSGVRGRDELLALLR